MFRTLFGISAQVVRSQTKSTSSPAVIRRANSTSLGELRAAFGEAIVEDSAVAESIPVARVETGLSSGVGPGAGGQSSGGSSSSSWFNADRAIGLGGVATGVAALFYAHEDYKRSNSSVELDAYKKAVEANTLAVEANHQMAQQLAAASQHQREMHDIYLQEHAHNKGLYAQNEALNRKVTELESRVDELTRIKDSMRP